MEKHLVIAGAGGMLGRLCTAHFSGRDGFRVTPLTRAEMDLEDSDAIRRALDAAGPFDALVNCAAWTEVDRCEDDPAKANQINGHAVGVMGEAAAAQNARVIHIGTDYVFDGEKPGPYVESDPTGPISTYGSSKLLGETELLRTSPDHTVIRVSWLFGPGKQGFPEWVIRQAMAKEGVKVVGDKWGSPTYAPDTVRQIEALLAAAPASSSGIFHLSNRGTCSWQAWGQACLDAAAEAGLPLQTRTLGAITMDELASLAGWKARRPRHSTLDPSKLVAATGIEVSTWDDAVRRFVRDHLAETLRA